MAIATMLLAVGFLAAALFTAFSTGVQWAEQKHNSQGEAITFLILLTLFGLFAIYLSGVL